MHRVAEIIAVGTELLLGQIVDTNSQRLSQLLARYGVALYRRQTVGDNLGRLVGALREALQRADLVLLTGGLGPTADDLTREAIAETCALPLRFDPAAWAAIQAHYRQVDREPAVSVRRQAMVPEGALAVANPRGTAPLLHVSWQGRDIIALPGPPRELEGLIEIYLEPYLQRTANSRLVSRVLRICGIGEAAMEQAVLDLIEGSQNPTLAPYAKADAVELRLTARAADLAEAEALLAPLEAEIRRRLGWHIFGTDRETLAEVVGRELVRRQESLAVAESCTGGGLAATLTAVPGASRWFRLGLVPYQEEAKSRVAGVSTEVLAEFGAVSQEVAVALASRVRALGNAALGLGITGFAGPSGGTPADPVGTVYIALSGPGDAIRVERQRFAGNREDVRRHAVQKALELLWKEFTDTPGG